MALLIRGKTTCPLCGSSIGEGDEVVATPAFLKNSHPLSLFSDAAFHSHCFAASEEHARVELLLERYKAKMAAAPTKLEEYEIWVKDAFQEFE